MSKLSPPDEFGNRYPPEAFALPGWRFRLWESPTKRVTLLQLQRLEELLSMSLVPGKYHLSDREFATVLRRIRSERAKMARRK